jgi:hypothetical protein
MDATTWIRLVFLLAFFGIAVYIIRSTIKGLGDAKRRQKSEYEAYQRGIDDQIRASGHSEEYVRNDRTIRALKDKHRNAKIGYIAAWIGGIFCLFFFPPIGLFLTAFALIATIREGSKLRKEMHDTAYKIKDARQSIPEK